MPQSVSVCVCLLQAQCRQAQTDGDLELSDSLTQLHNCGLPHCLSHAQHPHFHEYLILCV